MCNTRWRHYKTAIVTLDGAIFIPQKGHTALEKIEMAQLCQLGIEQVSLENIIPTWDSGGFPTP